MKDLEHQLQKSVIQWFRMQHPKLTIFAIPNGGNRHTVIAAKLKSEGVLAGVADLFLMKANDDYHGLFIEMKTGKNKQTDKQKEFESSALGENYLYETCYSLDGVISVINDYLANKKELEQ